MKFIEGFEDYAITREGLVFSFKWGREEGKVMRGRPDKDGYIIFCLRDGNQSYKKGHRLVAEAYLENPYDFPEVDHIDEDKSNNNLSNLRWCPTWFNVMRQNKREVRTKVHNITKIVYYRVVFRTADGTKSEKSFKDKDTAELFLKMIKDWIDNWDGTPKRPDFKKLWEDKISSA